MTPPTTSRLFPAAALGISLFLVLPLAADAQSRLALVGGRLIDGYGGAPLDNSVVLVEDDTIVAVGRQDDLDVPAGFETISTEGMSVLPGLWDLHVHLMIVGHADYDHWDRTYPSRFRNEIMPAAARQLLEAGVTSARELGAPLDDVLDVRDRIARGEIPGPTLYVSGPFLLHEPYPGTEAFRWGVDGADDARSKVRRLAKAGVDVIKLIDQDEMTMDEVEAVVEEAHRHDLPVVAHAHRAEEIRRGLAAGVDCFEHTGLGTAPGYPDDVLELLENRAQKLYWTPTVTPLYLYEITRENPERIDDPRWHLGLARDIIEDVRRSLRHVDRLPYYQHIPRRRPTVAAKVAELRRAGVTLLVGTDSGVPLTFHSDSTWRELDIWVNDLGIPAMEAIRAATYWPSVHLGVQEKVGTVSEGKTADIVAVRGDVLRDIALLRDPDVVVARGQRIR